jgi:hypothetical protein
MSTVVQLLALFDLVASSAPNAPEMELSSTVTNSIDSGSSNSDSDWKEFDMEMQEMQNQVNACPSWTKFASNNINQSGLYCQKNGQNYKCTSTPAGLSGISVGGCPANLNVKSHLRGKKHSDDSDDWMQQMNKEMQEMQNQINAVTSETPTERSLSQCAGFCANQPENCSTMSLECGGCPVCRRLKETEENTESKTSETPTERSLSQCAGFCANQPENCSTMSLWCGGCPVCRRLKETEENTESKTSETSDRQLDDSNDWKELDQRMQQLDVVMI